MWFYNLAAQRNKYHDIAQDQRKGEEVYINAKIIQSPVLSPRVYQNAIACVDIKENRNFG